jgi:transcriptional regulator with XRE-family HTH domain
MGDVAPGDPEPTPTEPPIEPEPAPEPTPTPVASEPPLEPAPSEPPLEPEPIETPPPDIAGAESPPLLDPTEPVAEPPAAEPGSPAAPLGTPPPVTEPATPADTTNGVGCCAEGPAEPAPDPAGAAGDSPEPEPAAPDPTTPQPGAAVHDGPVSVARTYDAAPPATSVSDRREQPAAAAGPAERESSAPVVAWTPRADPGHSPRPSPVDVVDDAVVASAGIAAGLAVVNRAPPAVAAAIEFGRLGGGWAGAIVFNLWLRRQMSARRMSQRQLAALSGVDHSTISRLLREDRQPSLTTATKLVHALRGVPSDAAEPATADFFDRMPEEVVFPARRVELALRADEELDDDQVRRLMTLYLSARRRSAESRAGPGPPQRIREPAARR